uniref:HAD-IA family hydrolase n=1 Tax=Pararhizobium sp. IMCC3301 TaxID=3067904 RepID=UPI002740F90C|nr:HAD-IA family hydrolase [Pararhizobium sp. IMCC3301]
MPKLTLFDLDGTLVDSEVLANQVLVEVLAEHGLIFSLQQAVERFRGGKMAESIAEVEAYFACKLPDNFIPDLRQKTALAFQEKLQPIDGAVDLVRSVSSQICIASNGPPEKIRLSLSLTGLQPYFGDRLFSAYDVQAWKPDPELFLSAARTLGVHPADCAVVEDSLPGIHGGLAAGMQVFAYFPDAETPPLPDAVIVVKHLSELQAHL